MIGLKTFAENLQTKLNQNLQGLTFAISPDTKTFEKSLRIGNSVKEKINGLLTLQSSDLSNLTDGQLFATISCRLQVIFGLKGGEDADYDKEVINPETGDVVEIIEGNISKVERVRDAMSAAFQKNTQETMSELVAENGLEIQKNYLVCTLYQFIETGNRDQVQYLGDSMTFTAYISYMIVENGINTHDIVYTLDGNIIPFQTNTAYRSPTMDANVYAGGNGAAKNLASQSIFTISFQLPALQNAVTRKMFAWLFGGELNVAHILNIRYPNFSGANFEESNYLVTYGENNASGETIKNVGQTMTLVEIIDDYEIVGIPDTYFIYERTGAAVNSLSFAAESYFYDFNTKQFGHVPIAQETAFTVNNGNILISIAPLTRLNGFTVVQAVNNEVADVSFKVNFNSGKLIAVYPQSYQGTGFKIQGNKLIATTNESFMPVDLKIENGKLILTR